MNAITTRVDPAGRENAVQVGDFAEPCGRARRLTGIVVEAADHLQVRVGVADDESGEASGHAARPHDQDPLAAPGAAHGRAAGEPDDGQHQKGDEERVGRDVPAGAPVRVGGHQRTGAGGQRQPLQEPAGPGVARVRADGEESRQPAGPQDEGDHGHSADAGTEPGRRVGELHGEGEHGDGRHGVPRDERREARGAGTTSAHIGDRGVPDEGVVRRAGGDVVATHRSALRTVSEGATAAGGRHPEMAPPKRGDTVTRHRFAPVQAGRTLCKGGRPAAVLGVCSRGLFFIPRGRSLRQAGTLGRLPSGEY